MATRQHGWSLRRQLRRYLPATWMNSIDRARQMLRLRAAERAIRGPIRPARDHELPGELIVSLTSYPPRFATLSKTLESLRRQTVRPDRIVLWLAHGDVSQLPATVKDIAQVSNIEIRECADTKSYKKLIPALAEWPDAFIVTADDDLYFEPTWLEQLVSGAEEGENVVVCRRAHKPMRTAGSLRPYVDWEWDFIGHGEIFEDLFPTTGSGALYPPGSLHEMVSDQATFMSICPTADDVWLYCLARMAGSRFKQVGTGFAQVSWKGSQDVSLTATNLSGANDVQLRRVFEFAARVSGGTP